MYIKTLPNKYIIILSWGDTSAKYLWGFSSVVVKKMKIARLLNKEWGILLMLSEILVKIYFWIDDFNKRFIE